MDMVSMGLTPLGSKVTKMMSPFSPLWCSECVWTEWRGCGRQGQKILCLTLRFSSRRYLCAWESPSVLRPISQTFPQSCLTMERQSVGQVVANSEMKVPSPGNPELSKVFTFKAGMGENVALHASPTAKKSVSLISDFSIHSTFFPSRSSLNIKWHVASTVN